MDIQEKASLQKSKWCLLHGNNLLNMESMVHEKVIELKLKGMYNIFKEFSKVYELVLFNILTQTSKF